MKTASRMTKETLNSLFEYRGDGSLVWRTRSFGSIHDARFNKCFAGSDAGKIEVSPTGYKSCRISVYDVLYTRARIVWIMHHGPVPAGMIVDHISRDSVDDRIENLRLASRNQNARNRKLNKNSVSGYKGVSVQPGGRWRSGIGFDGKTITIGFFSTKFEAAMAYDEKAKELHGDFASLNFPEKHYLTWRENFHKRP